MLVRGSLGKVQTLLRFTITSGYQSAIASYRIASHLQKKKKDIEANQLCRAQPTKQQAGRNRDLSIYLCLRLCVYILLCIVQPEEGRGREKASYVVLRPLPTSSSISSPLLLLLLLLLLLVCVCVCVKQRYWGVHSVAAVQMN